MTDITRLEEQIAHLTRTVEDLSDVVARQERDLALALRRVDELSDVAADQTREIARMGRLLMLLMEREAEREYSAGGQIPLADQKPPHW